MAKGWLAASSVAGIALMLLVWLFSLLPIAQRADNQFALGLFYGWRGPLAAPDGAVIVALDRETVSWLREAAGDPGGPRAELPDCLPPEALGDLVFARGPGSLPRSVHACLLQRLGEIGFRVVVFDILFSVQGDAEDDRRLAQAITRHGGTAILVGLERSTVRDGASELLVEREVSPFAAIRESAAGVGTFVVPRNGAVYGYWRTVPGFETTPALPDEVLRLHTIFIGGAAARAEEGRDFEYLWLYGPPGSIRTVSARDVLAGRTAEDLDELGGNLVAFVGASDPDTADYVDSFPSFFRGPVGSGISGVELATTAFLNLVTGERLRRGSDVAEWGLVGLFAFGLGFLARARSGYAMAAAPLAALVYLLVAAAIFVQSRLLLPVAAPVFVAAPAAFLLAVIVRYRFARALLMHLAPAPAARRMLARGTDQQTAAISDEATVAFFDLIGSSGIAEKISPLAFSTLLNAYHETVATQVARERGVVGAFSGDGVMAIFSRSDAGPEHAAHACRAAIRVVAGISELNARHSETALPPLHLRIGLSSGNVAEGEIGSRQRFNFSVVGDVVNLAARLEKLGKDLFPGETDVILVSAATCDLAQGHGFEFTDCGTRPIIGREQPARVYRLAFAHPGI